MAFPLTVFLLALCFTYGIVLSSLWQWFVVPFGLPPINFQESTGMLMIVVLIRQLLYDSAHVCNDDEHDDEVDGRETYASAIWKYGIMPFFKSAVLYPATILSAGFLLHLCAK